MQLNNADNYTKRTLYYWGHKEGRKEVCVEVATRALKHGYSVEEIAELTGLSAKEIEALQK